MKSCTTPKETSSGLNIFSKPMFQPLYIKTKSAETTVIVIRWPDLLSANSHWFIRSYSRLNKERSVNLTRKYVKSRAALVLLSWCDISVILQSYFDHILTGGRKCCLNVIPAGSFSLSLPLPPLLFSFFLFPILAQMSLFAG